MEYYRRALADELILHLECSFVACVCDEYAQLSMWSTAVKYAQLSMGAPHWGQYSSGILAELLAHPGIVCCARYSLIALTVCIAYENAADCLHAQQISVS
jgi:hypothetical protein